MNRRGFLLTATVLARLKPSRSAFLCRSERESSAERPQSLTAEGWRIFEVKTHVHVQNASGVTRVWLPTPLVGAPYQQTLGDTYIAENGRVVMVEGEDLDLLLAEWTEGASPVVDLTSRIATRAHAVDLTTPKVAPPADLSSFERFLRPTRLYAVDGSVRALASGATRGAGTDIDKARAIGDWIGARVSKSGSVACGLADPQCADRNALFAALSRAAGIPARVLYGLSLVSTDATKAQRSRGEVYLVGFGWVPLDAGRLFGSWDETWIALNSAQDVVLPKAKHGTLPFFMHPQAETANGSANSLEPATFRYDIDVRESA